MQMPEMNEKKILKFIVIFFCCVVCGLIIFTFTGVASYSFWQWDDFTHAVSMGYSGNNLFGLIAASFQFAWKRYTGMTGTYFAMLLQGLLSSLNGFGALELKIVMVLHALLLFATIFCFIVTVGKKLQINMFYSFILYTAVLFSLFVYKSWTEIFYWFSGSVSYSFPMVASLLGVVTLLRAKQKKGGVCPFCCPGVCGFWRKSGGSGCKLLAALDDSGTAVTVKKGVQRKSCRFCFRSGGSALQCAGTGKFFSD